MVSSERHGLIARLIGWCARHPGLCLAVAAVLIALGVRAATRVPLDAVPDLSDAQVIILTEWKGRGPDLVEDQVTYPIVSRLLSTAHVKSVRGQSFFGLSFVNVIFADGTDLYWARSRVLEQLASVSAKLPSGAQPTLGPDATGVGWVFEYALVDRTGRHDLSELRSLQDFHLRYALASVDGVAEVANMGGSLKQWQVLLDPQKLEAWGVTSAEVTEAVRAANGAVGGRVIEIAGHEHALRGQGYVRTKEDLERAPIRMGADGAPILVRDVATVAFGPELGRGIVELDGEGECVGGVVVMRWGGDALAVIDAVKARIEEARRSLPEGVELVTTYDRSELIRRAIATLQRTLLEEVLVVSLVIAAFLLHARTALVAIVTLPAAVILAFIPMHWLGLGANIMSLGGIAVAIGAMVDAAIVMVENVHRRLAERPDAERMSVVVAAMQEVGPSLFFALLVITASFVPVFALQGAEGRLFRPLAATKTCSMAAAALLAITVIPALTVLALRGRGRAHTPVENPLELKLIAIYAPIARACARHPWPVVALALAALASTALPWSRLQGEFMPDLNEGSILYMPTSPPGMSITEATRLLQVTDRELKGIPEVARVFGKMGSAETATDPAPLNMAETVVTLKPEAEWRPGMTWEKLIAEIKDRLDLPGMPPIVWMPIQTRTDMLATGVRAPVAVKVLGPTVEAVQDAALRVERTLHEDAVAARLTAGAYAERLGGGFFLDLSPRRDELARLGLTVESLNRELETAIGGDPIAQAVSGRERYPIQVRYARGFRDDIRELARLPISTPAGIVQLGSVAEVRTVSGPMMVSTEGGQVVGLVYVDVAPGMGIPEYVRAVQPALEKLAMPGIRLEWAGQYQHWQSAMRRLMLVVPLTIAVVALLLWLNTRSLVQTLLVLSAVPFSLIGAAWLLWLLGYKLSVAAWVGMIALAGLDAETGVVMLLYLGISWRARLAAGACSQLALEGAIVEGAAHRIRPKLMTVACLLIGLLPVMWSHGTGADVMKRIAAPMVGGIVSSFLLELLVYPAAFALWKRREALDNA
jgi:Cu(I)/Ag(I) efflux system membrane protein CusA/SilA